MNNVVAIVRNMSTLHIHICGTECFNNSHYGYCKPLLQGRLHQNPMLVCCGQRDIYTHPPTEVEFTSYIGCVLLIHQSDVWWLILEVKQCISHSIVSKVAETFQ